MLRFIKKGIEPQLEILEQTLVNGTSQQKMYAVKKQDNTEKGNLAQSP